MMGCDADSNRTGSDQMAGDVRERTSETAVYTGSYTPDSSGQGRGTGISVHRQDPETGELRPAGPVTPVSGPSYLAHHPSGRFLYATNERPDGAVTAFQLDERGLPHPIGSQPTGGADPCHLSVDPTGRYLVTANYTSGSVAVHPINPDGSLGERTDLVTHHGSGPVSDRQEGAHCHQARFDPSGQTLLVNDLGTDRVHAYRLSGGTLSEIAVTELAPGTGPRHLVFTGRQVQVAAELSSTVSTFDYVPERGELALLRRIDASSRRSGVANFPSEIVASADGRWVYVANRGENSVSVLRTGPDGLTQVGEVDCAGDWPRHLLLLDSYLYVANQNSDGVAVFHLDTGTGQPTFRHTVPVPSPACLLAAPA